LAAAFFGAASAGAQRPLKLMVGPTLILMLLGMLVGVGHRWGRRWWFLRTRPNRASLRPRSVEAVLDTALKQAPEIKEVGVSLTAGAGSSSTELGVSLSQPAFPAPPAVPIVETSNRAASFAPTSPAPRDHRRFSAASSEAPPSRDTEPERDSEPAEPRSEHTYAEGRSEPSLEERRSEPGYTAERRSDVPAHRPSRHSVPPQERTWMSNTVRTPRPPSEMPPELGRPASLPPEPLAQVGMVSMPTELSTSILALEQSLSDAPAPLSTSSRAPKSSRRPSRRASRAPSAAAAAPSVAPSVAPPSRASRSAAVSATPVARSSQGTAAAASLPVEAQASLPAPPVASAAPAVAAQPLPSPPPPAPRSSVQPVAQGEAPSAETPESGWRDVLDVHGTASGW
jgi:hypothetical protein